MAETVKLRPVFERGVPQQNDSDVILDASFFVLAERGEEELVDLRRPVHVGDGSIAGVVRIVEGNRMSEDVVAGSVLFTMYLSLVLSPYLRTSSIISPSPWSSTFSRNLDDLLKKSAKFLDLMTEFSSSFDNST